MELCQEIRAAPPKRMIIDLSSVCWTSLLVGEDKESGYTVDFDGKKIKVNSARYGYNNAIDFILGQMTTCNLQPIDLIFVAEGTYSKSLRKSMHEDYKEDRETRPKESYEEFNKAKEQIISSFLQVGSSVCSQSGVEADDVIAYLAQSLEGEKIILSADKDLAVLNGNGVRLLRKGEFQENPWGDFPSKYITLCKALVGGKDNVKGVKGFGNVAFLKMYHMYGVEGMELLQKLIEESRISELEEDVADFPPFKKIIESEEELKRSWAVSKLYPSLINTLRNPLEWGAGKVAAREFVQDDRLQPFAGVSRLVHAGNADSALAWVKGKLQESPSVALDIETSTPPESDDWVMNAGKNTKGDYIVDVFGSELTGLSLTFGANNQYTLYFTVDHDETDNVKNTTTDKVLELIKLIPKGIPLAVQNDDFELPILYALWGDKLKDNGFGGFLPYVYDTNILAGYVDENLPSGLKASSLHYLGYKQVDYKEVTTVNGIQHKMNQLPAMHVLDYGTDDTICTVALFNFYRIRTELENTFRVYEKVAIFPSYSSALSFHQGVDFSLETMRELEAEDGESADAANAVLNDYLVKVNWDGVKPPQINITSDEKGFIAVSPADFKEAFQCVMGKPLDTRSRTLKKLVVEAVAQGWETAGIFLEKNLPVTASRIQSMVDEAYVPKPKFEASKGQHVTKLIYGEMGLPVSLINNVTDKEKVNQPRLAQLCYDFKRAFKEGKPFVASKEDMMLLRKKAKVDADAITFAYIFHANEEQKKVLDALRTINECATRKNLYYKNYPKHLHWKDGKLHPNINQGAAVTGRYSGSNPNLQQLPKKGEGVKFRKCFIPHSEDALILSVDEKAQELRIIAAKSQDGLAMSCYVGKNLRDPHSITAAYGMDTIWGKELTKERYALVGKEYGKDDAYDVFMELLQREDTQKAAKDLRSLGKKLNFTSEYGAQAVGLAIKLLIPVQLAQKFLDAREAAHAGVVRWKNTVRTFLHTKGYTESCLGRRRHLRHKILSQNRYEALSAERMGINYEIQGSAAEQLQLAIGNVWKSGILFDHDVRFIAPVHDETVYSIGKSCAHRAVKAISGAMAEPYGNLDIPFLGSASIGKNYGEQIECGDEYNEAAVDTALSQI